MKKGRIQGSIEQAKGKVKEAASTATGDTKLESEGKAQKRLPGRSGIPLAALKTR